MTFAEKMKGLAKDAHKHLVLPEGLEPRTVRAARIIADEGIAASVTLIGNEAEVRANAENRRCSDGSVRRESLAGERGRRMSCM